MTQRYIGLRGISLDDSPRVGKPPAINFAEKWVTFGVGW